MTKAIIDASTLIAFVKGEDGKDEARKWLPSSKISAINYAEVLLKLGIESEDVRLIKAIVRNLDVEIVQCDRAHAEEMSKLIPLDHQGLSLADRCCLTLGKLSNGPVVTSNRAWATLGLDLEIVLFRNAKH